MKSALCFLFFIFSATAAATNVKETIEGNFEGGRNTGYFQYDPSDVSAGVSYFSKAGGAVHRYKIEVEGECGILQIYRPYKTNDKIMLDGSCQGQGSQVHQYLYQWDKKYNDWCLREEVLGERADRTSGFDEQLSTRKVKGCIRLGLNRK